MADDTKTTEVLVLTDESGNTYAIPRETLDRYKLSGVQKAALEQELKQDDVQGFASMNRVYAERAAVDAAANAASVAANAAQANNASAYANSAMLAAASAPMVSGMFANVNLAAMGFPVKV